MQKQFEVIDGIECYAPSLALKNSGFKEESFDHLFDLEEGNFWFEGRARIVKHLVQKFSVKENNLDFLEIGCGTGFMLNRLSSIPRITLVGSEIYLAGLRFAQKRLPKTEFIQLDATNIPFEQRYDAIGAFDVLEHIEDDEQVIDQVSKALRANGSFFITVPQYPWMWSHLDDYACHKRRYIRKELADKLKKHGFEIKYIGSFVFSLFPVMIVSRYFKKNKKTISPTSEFRIPTFLNTIFTLLIGIDFMFIKMGVSLPFGGSLVCVAEKSPG